ncbi:MAG: ABC transporter permease [Anaerolineae bacterium]|nr:ABC transporter permease [Anaerolineae bacterium]
MLSLIVSVLFVVVLYRALPMIERMDPPTLVLYDAGDAALTPMLENSTQFDVRTGYTDEEAMHYRLTHEEAPALGLTIPANFDAALATGSPPELTGYVLHWVTAKDAQALQQLAESEIAALLSVAVPVRLAEERVFPRPDSGGLSVSLSMSTVYITVMIAMLMPPNLMLEERNAKTLDALLVSPATAAQVTMGKAVAGLLYALLGCLISFALNGPVMVQWGLAVVACVVGALFAVSLGLLLATLLESRQQLMLWGWVILVPLLLPMMLFLMEDLVPRTLFHISAWTPITVLFRLLRASFAGAVAVSDWAAPLLLLAAYAAGMLGLVVCAVRRTDRA